MASSKIVFSAEKALFDLDAMTLTEEKKDKIEISDLLKVLQDCDGDKINITITKVDSVNRYLK